MPIYSNFYQTLTTACPIVELRGYAAACGLKGHLYAYLDFYGPTGTARDGLAEGMLALAIEKKQLAPGQPIIEAASGPFATALTLASLTAGHPIVLVMPEDAPALRQEYLLRLGAQIRHSPARSSLAVARALAGPPAAANGRRPASPNATTAPFPTTLPTMTTRSITAGSPALPLCKALPGRTRALWTPSPSGWAAPAR